MDFPRKTKLAASFVVTVSAIAGCRKQTVTEPPGPHDQPAYVSRNGNVCLMMPPQYCPQGASCNPPPPDEVECPPSLLDAGEPAPASPRPPGKEDWLRVKPHMYTSQYGGGYTPERFCAAPPRPYECTPTSPVNIKSAPVAMRDGGPSDAGTVKRYDVESFVYKDGLGACRRVPAFVCTEGECTKDMPVGEPSPCP